VAAAALRTWICEKTRRLEAGRESDDAVGAVVPSQHATVTVLVSSESAMRDEAMGAVAQRHGADCTGECESEIEQRLWASASWVITSTYQSQVLGL
jgi:transcriptional regulator of nitric oxide reductase